MEPGVVARQATVSTEATDYSAEIDLSQAYLRLRDPIFRYVRRFASDDDEAAELTARTFERAVAKLPSYRGGKDNFATWVFRIARSQAVDATRRRRPLYPLALIRAHQHPHSGEGRPEVELMRGEASRHLAERVQQLAPLERECLALRYDGGLSARQIGFMIGKTEAATQKMISRALARLRELYE
jgi:RNA polymerase sigma factor (sigma-70 family)